MTRSMVVLFVIVELADFATYLLAPHLEANPLMAAMPPMMVGIAKTGGVALTLFIVSRIRTPSIQALSLSICTAIAAFGFGTNVAVLSLARMS